MCTCKKKKVGRTSRRRNDIVRFVRKCSDSSTLFMIVFITSIHVSRTRRSKISFAMFESVSDVICLLPSSLCEISVRYSYFFCLCNVKRKREYMIYTLLYRCIDVFRRDLLMEVVCSSSTRKSLRCTKLRQRLYECELCIA